MGVFWNILIAQYLAFVVIEPTQVLSQTTPSVRGNVTSAPPDPCATTPCLNNGSCTAVGSNYNCSCSVGWLGSSCSEVDPCYPNPCLNQGVCSLSAEGYNCKCLIDWKGINCSEVVTPCESSPCQNGATCNRLNATNYNCTCPPGFNGTVCQSELDPCESSPCQNDGTCTKYNGTDYSCECMDGFNGTQCENDIDECASSPCQNGGVCTDAANNYTCQCAMGWEGYNCSEDVNECMNDKHQCHVNANCTNTVGNYSCECVAGYSGDGFSCTFLDPCVPNPCVKGTCISNMFTYQCICPAGWSGVNCSADIDECAMNTSDCHPQFGMCNNTGGGYNCTCLPGYTGDGKICDAMKLYPYNKNMSSIAEDEEIQGPFYVLGGLPISGVLYHKIYVYSNGYITVKKPYHSPNPLQDGQYPPGVPLLAPYWTNFDLTDKTGSVFVDVYDLQSEPSDLKTDVVEMVKTNAKQYGALEDFLPSFVMVVTWDKVSPFPANLTSRKESATFQAVIATDSTQSFVLFNYEREKFSLEPESLRRRILIGYSDGLNMSSSLMPSDILKPWNASNIFGVHGRIIYKLGAPVKNNDLPCIQWYLGEMNKSDTVPRSDYGCPCTQQQAELDSRLKLSSQSHLPAYSCWQYRQVSPDTPAQPLCCYDKLQALVLGDGASHLLVSKVNNTEQHRTCCVSTNLCQLYYKLRPVDNCDSYEPPQSALVWGDPHIVTLDGLRYTFNGKGEYTLMNAMPNNIRMQGRMEMANSIVVPKMGNATLLTAVAAKDNMSDTVEVRRAKTAGSIVYNDLEILINGSIHLKLSELKVGELLSFKGLDVLKPNMTTKTSGVVNQQISVQFLSGFGFQVSVREDILRLHVLIDKRFEGAGSTSGLLGTYDGNQANDLTGKDGTIVDLDAKEEDMYNIGKTWQLRKNESLFTYDVYAYDDINDFSYQPTFFGDMLGNISGNFPAINMSILDASLLCGVEKMRECIIDYIATGSGNVAGATKNIYEDFEQTVEMLGMKERMLTEKMNSSVEARGGTAYDITLYATFFSSADKSRQWRWTSPVYNGKPWPLMKPVTDEEYGTNYLYWPQVQYDQCEKGEADFSYLSMLDYSYSPERFYLAQCQCQPGYRGSSCTETVDECLPNRCFANCTVEADGEMGFVCSPCPAGMAGNGLRCYEENECITQEPCSQICENILGGYKCSCKPGYKLETDNKTCSDVDDCVTGHTCIDVGQYCYNTPGSYECRCKANFYMVNGTCKEAPRRFGGIIKFKVLQPDSQKEKYSSWVPELADSQSTEFKEAARLIEETVGVPYQDKFGNDYYGCKVNKLSEGSIVGDFDLIFSDSASVNGSVLKQTFADYLVSQDCLASGPDCRLGPLLGVDVGGSTAGDKDLCANPFDNDCDQSSTICSSANGKYVCACKPGYKRWLDYTNVCQDIDECAGSSSPCIANQSVCENLPGTYRCQCFEGFTRWENTCRDVCDPNPCQNGGSCSKTSGGYSCKCDGLWGGPNCSEEHEAAIRFRTIAIIVGAVFGGLCLILLIILIYACCKVQKGKNSYSCRSRQQKNGGYYPGGEVSLETWGEASTLPHDRTRQAGYPVPDNGSKQNLLGGGAGKTNPPVDPENDSNMPVNGAEEYSAVNETPKASSTPTNTAQGVQNPAYTENGNNSNNATADLC